MIRPTWVHLGSDFTVGGWRFCLPVQCHSTAAEPKIPSFGKWKLEIHPGGVSVVSLMKIETPLLTSWRYPAGCSNRVERGERGGGLKRPLASRSCVSNKSMYSKSLLLEYGPREGQFRLKSVEIARCMASWRFLTGSPPQRARCSGWIFGSDRQASGITHT